MTWFRTTERRTKSAKSVFNFRQKQGCVPYSTHAGIPWLRFIRQHFDTSIHFWPFDGWPRFGSDAVDAAREQIGRAIFATWGARDIDELVRLMRKFADAIKANR